MDARERQAPEGALLVPRVTRVAGVVSAVVLRYGLAFFLLTGGIAKFTAAEAQLIHPFLAHSPLFGWWYGAVGLQTVSGLIGVVEIVLAVLLALHLWKPGLAAIGGLLAAGEFVVTLSFNFTTPNLAPVMSAFLMKDLILFGAAVWCLNDSLRRSLGRR